MTYPFLLTLKLTSLLASLDDLSCPTAHLMLIYLSLVRSQISYCCQIWRPCLVKECSNLEKLQRRAIKFILSDYHSDYKSSCRLIALNLLPISLCLWMELQDILLFIKLVQLPPDNFSLLNYISFVSSSCHSCRSSSPNKIKSSNSRIPRLNSTRHFYMNQIVQIWNSPSGS